MRSIFHKLVLSFLLVAVVPLSIGGVISYRMSVATLKEQAIRSLVLLSAAKAENIEEFFREKRRDVQALSRQPFYIDAVAALVAAYDEDGLGSAPYEALVTRYRPGLEAHADIFGYHDILFISPEGDVIFSVAGEADLGTNVETGPYRDTELARSFEKVRVSLQTEVSRFREYGPSGEPAIFVVAPVMRGGVFVGALAMQLDKTRFYAVTEDYKSLGRTGEVVVVSKEGEHVLFVAPLRHDADAAFRRMVPLGIKESLPVQEAVQGRAGLGESVDYRGRKIFAVWRYLPVSGLGVEVKIDVEEVFAPIDVLKNHFLVAMLATILGVTALSVFVSRAITGPLERLKEGTEIIRAGRLDYNVATDGKDEVGQLSRAIAQMTRDLADDEARLKEEVAQKERSETALEKAVLRLEKGRKAMIYLIEDLNKVSKSLDRRSAELEAANKELEAFSYSVSHDLRAPLRAIDGFSRILLEDYDAVLDEAGKGHLSRVCKGVAVMGELIDDLLKLSQATRKKMEYEDVRLSELAAEIAGELREADPDRRVEVVIAPGLTAKGDRHLIGAVLRNLMGNAWKFTRKKEDARIEVGVIRQDGKRTFFVRDNGAGFDMKYADKLFQPFQRLHTSAEFPGTGIGLATVNRIVVRHGGSARAEGAVNEGATVYFTLG